MIVRCASSMVLALMIAVPSAGAQGVIRDGVTFLEAGKIILSVLPDSLDGVHLRAEPRGGKKNVEATFGARFDPTRLVTWLKQAEVVAHDSTTTPPLTGELQSPALIGLDGTMEVTVGRLWKNKDSTSTIYWVFRFPDRQKPFLIKADLSFSQRFAAALRLAATRSNLDSTAFASGLVEPIGVNAADDSLCPKPLRIPAPKYPPALLSAGTQGLVEVRYVIDTTGRVDMTTFEVLGATHEGFIQPAKEALATGSFRPARHQGVKVRRRVWQRISFRIG